MSERPPSRGAVARLRLAWRCRWNVLRLALAAFVVWVLAADTGARLARLQLAAMPDFDYAAEVRALRLEGRFGEAVMIADAGLRHVEGPAREQVLREKALTESEQASWLRRAKDAGAGALTGRGDSLEALVGAVAADFFVVGDVRDLVVQGGRQLLDGDSDQVVLLLSVVGLVTTLAPEIDWAPSILKAARKAGHLTESLAQTLVTLIKGKRTKELGEVFADVASAAEHSAPGAAMRLLRHCETADDVRALARFLERHPDAALALHVGGQDAATFAKAASAAGDAGLRAQEALLKAARKGPAGVRFLASPAGRALVKPHPLVGLAKVFWKGHAEKIITRAVDRFDPDAWWLLPAAAAWALLELALLWRKIAAPVRA